MGVGASPPGRAGRLPRADERSQSGAVTTFADEAALPAPYGDYARAVRIIDCAGGGACSGIAKADLRQVTITVTYRPMTGVGGAGIAKASRRHDTHRQAMTMRTFVRSARAAVSSFGSERGVALPMALLSLVILSALIAGFSVMSAIEPTIANNQLAVAQARALAEAGVERALWALSNPADAQGIPATFTTPPSPYDGGRLVPVVAGGHPVGGFRVTVTNGPTAYERRITAVGFVPNDTTAGRRALRKITVTALNPQLIVKDPPAALSVRGELRAGGTLRVDSRTDGAAGQRSGRSRAARRHSRVRPRTSAAPAATGPRATGSPTRREESSLPHPVTSSRTPRARSSTSSA